MPALSPQTSPGPPMSGPPRRIQTRDCVFSPGAGNCVNRQSEILRKTLPRQAVDTFQVYQESAQQGKIRFLSTKMDCNLPPLMREEQQVSTRSPTPLLMLENPEGLLPGSTFKWWGLGGGERRSQVILVTSPKVRNQEGLSRIQEPRWAHPGQGPPPSPPA